MERQIVCYQIPSFEIALARLENTALRERPVAIAPARTPRACVHELSSEAEREGVYAGMPVGDARRLCPSLRILPPDPLRVRLAQQDLLRVITRFAPVWEPVRPGNFFLDLTGTSRLFGRAADTAARIEREVVQRHGLPGVMGVGSSKLVAHIAARLVQPVQLCDVRQGSERMFLAPLPVTTLLPELSRFSGHSILTLLEDLNLRTLGEIAAVPLSHLALVLGKQAPLLHQWANGIDSSPVLSPIQRPAVEATLTLASDEVNDGRLLNCLYGLLEELCRTLRRQQRVCRRLTLILLHSDDVKFSRHQNFGAGTHWEVDMYPCLKGLFLSCFTRRVRIRRMTLRAEVLAAPQEQLSLFEMETPETCKHTRMRRLSLALDHLRGRFGKNVVSWGTVADRFAGPASGHLHRLHEKMQAAEGLRPKSPASHSATGISSGIRRSAPSASHKT